MIERLYWMLLKVAFRVNVGVAERAGLPLVLSLGAFQINPRLPGGSAGGAAGGAG